MKRIANYNIILSALLCFYTASVTQAQTSEPALNVMDFGAIPNDDIDDTAAIQSALDFSTDTKFQYVLNSYYFRVNTVYIPSGLYLVKGLIVKNSYTRIKGDGPESSVLKLSSGAEAVINLKGASYVEIDHLAIDGSDLASYGIFANDIGQQTDAQGKLVDYASVRGTLNSVQVRKARGNPGIGFANNDRAHSWRIIGSTFRENNIGIKLVRRAQHTQIIESSVYANYNQQLVLGDGYSFLRDITIRDTNIEGRDIGTGELIRVDGVDPLNLDSTYFEGHRNLNAMDLLTVNLPSTIVMTSVYSNGGATTPPLRSILLKTETNLSIEGARYLNTQKVYEIGAAEGNPQWAKPLSSKILIKNSKGPGLKNGLALRQGGASWDDGYSLTNGAHTWDMVVGADGILYFGYNQKTKMVLTPAGVMKTYP